MVEKGRIMTLTDRRELRVSGVKEVISFDEAVAELDTADGRLCVEGEGIRLGALDGVGGDVLITGRICSLSYKEDAVEKRRGAFGRLFG